MVAEIEAKAAKLREQLGSEIVGMEKIRHQNPLQRMALLAAWHGGFGERLLRLGRTAAG